MNVIINTAYSTIELYFFEKEKKEGKLFTITSNNNHTKKLYELYYDAIKDLNIKTKDLNKIYIVNGPGSYTGLRIGMVFAKTIAMIQNIEIAPLNLLEIVYYTNNEKIVLLDARGGKFFMFDGKQKLVLFGEELEKIKINNDYTEDSKINYQNISEYLNKVKKMEYKKIEIEYLRKVL